MKLVRYRRGVTGPTVGLWLDDEPVGRGVPVQGIASRASLWSLSRDDAQQQLEAAASAEGAWRSMKCSCWSTARPRRWPAGSEARPRLPAERGRGRRAQDLGADTLNLQADLDLGQIAAIRAEVGKPLDIYVEAPDNVGEFLRYHELAELVRVAAPVYLKFGLRHAPDIYPSGTHLDDLTAGLSAERVRRARIGMEALERAGVDSHASVPGAPGLAVPQPAN